MDVAMFLAGFLVSGLRSCTPLFYVLLGETLTERVGVVNLGVEGQMLIGAFFGFAATVWTGNPWFGMLAGAAAGMALSLVHGILCVTLKANFLRQRRGLVDAGRRTQRLLRHQPGGTEDRWLSAHPLGASCRISP